MGFNSGFKGLMILLLIKNLYPSSTIREWEGEKRIMKEYITRASE